MLSKDNKIILKIRTGSHLYGTNTSNSDEDFVIVFLPTKDELIGLNPKEDSWQEIVDGIDCTYYSFRKFLKLCLNGNPNLIELLFLNKENIIDITAEGSELLELKTLFLFEKVQSNMFSFAHNIKKLLHKNTKGSKRKDLINQYGYDVKSAYHIIRLYMELKELLLFGTIYYPLQNRDLLLKIRNGEFTYSEFCNLELKLRNELELMMLDFKLSNKPDYDKINEFCKKVLKGIVDG